MRLEYFRMIDRVVALNPVARTITAGCLVPEASPIFEGHFPGYPLLPGVLMIETMAQAGGWLIMAMQRFSNIPFLAQVKDAKLRSFITPGQPLTAHAELVHEGSGYAVANGRLFAKAALTAEAEIRYRLVSFPNEALRNEMLTVARAIALPEAFVHA